MCVEIKRSFLGVHNAEVSQMPHLFWSTLPLSARATTYHDNSPTQTAPERSELLQKETQSLEVVEDQ